MEKIQTASDADAKAVLVALCGVDPFLARRASNFLSQMEALAKAPQEGTKRKADSTVQICTQCQDPFYEEDNDSQACRYHDGNLNEDTGGDFWADHDDGFGEIDTVEMREEFPEGFIWDCCDKRGHEKGCKRGKHSAISGSRGRYGNGPGTVVFGQDSASEEEDLEEEDED